jgi:hypothetical protein
MKVSVRVVDNTDTLLDILQFAFEVKNCLLYTNASLKQAPKIPKKRNIFVLAQERKAKVMLSFLTFAYSLFLQLIIHAR